MAACAGRSSVISPSLRRDLIHDNHSDDGRDAALTPADADADADIASGSTTSQQQQQQLRLPRGAAASSSSSLSLSPPAAPVGTAAPPASAETAATAAPTTGTTAAAATGASAGGSSPKIDTSSASTPPDRTPQTSSESFDASSTPSAAKARATACLDSLGALTPPTAAPSPGSSFDSIPVPVTAHAFRHASLPPSPHQQLPSAAVRKTSPGLAARLKALGFGTSRKPPSPPPSHHDPVGRLDEDQLRQLDRKLQAASFSAVIARRGRPWKGAAAAADSSTSLVAAQSPQLPEIRASEPLAMDTHKYRMPDHTDGNGNGFKTTPDIRRDHIHRIARPPSPDDAAPPPPPPPKDTPPLAMTPPAVAPADDFAPGLNSYFTPGHNRPGSIYTISRASFANQLAQLTSLQLPDPESLSSKVSAIRTAQVASKALINAAEQIRSWIHKAQEVIGGLDSEDDVEWAAAGGREGLEEVENAITRFEDLINVYISAIEELQGRSDIATVSPDDLRRAVAQMESIIDEWANIRATLQGVRTQVETAMEWEELWSNVLGDIQGEMDELSRLVFEMEERRHRTFLSATGGDGVDIGDLETIVEDSPAAAAAASRLQAPNRLSLAGLPMSPSSPGSPGLSLDDSSLLALFARMQPLRASLDFLPMRLSVFQARAERSFPTACEELEMRRNGLDASYRKLERDAESLRKELGEDRWVIVFRGAGRQAQKMLESVQRSLLKLWEALDTGVHLTNPASMTKKMEGYEAKKTHYGPAIERVLAIIERGVRERLTVNGEILRLHADTQSRWETLKCQMRDMDAILDDVLADRKGQQLRDSVSSLLSNDRSTQASGLDTPGSSPPSSVIMSSLGFDPHTPAPKAKGRSPGAAGNAAPFANRRHSSLPAPTAQLNRRTGTRLATIASSAAAPPPPPSKTPRPGSSFAFRPRWNTSTNVAGLDTGHHSFQPLSLSTPSPQSKSTPGGQRSASALSPSTGGTQLPTPRSTLLRASSESPSVRETTPSRTSHSRISFRERLASPGPYSQQTLSKPRLLSSKSSMSTLTASKRRASLQQAGSEPQPGESPFHRPASSLAVTSRRSSLLPLPKSRREESSSTGRLSPRLSAISRSSMRKVTPSEPKDSKPRWRH